VNAANGGAPVEIERKFLLVGEGWLQAARGEGRRLRQGYLCAEPGRSVRVRVCGDDATLTVKGPLEGISRMECQYVIPPTEGEAMLALCPGPLIDKTRYEVWHEGLRWEVDIFHGDNEGLRIAEIELESESQSIPLPDWVGREVSGDRRYYNSSLTSNPYRAWVVS
jgi:adenylate cyclase